ncbi:MAG: SMP-30/gluconolactonase/LRE family protein [Pseudomonadota bacterium]|nr:SMP-30/gluconolactonase/LRE family protein [Pseudomonadota bacterium]
MKTSTLSLLLLLLVPLSHTRAQETHADVIRLDPALDKIVPQAARVEMLKDGAFGISEGPVWIPQGNSGYLLFSDIAANVIYKWTADGQMSVFLKDSGFTGDLTKDYMEGFMARSGPLYVFDFGSNGITVDQQGRIVFCAQGDRAVVRLEKDGTRTVLASEYQGKRLNRPNDLVVKSDGAVYFTDPNFNIAKAELPYSGVFMVKNGKVQLLASDFVPNGIAFSPDEKILYVNGGFDAVIGFRGRPGIRRYDVLPDGTLGNGRLFIDMSGEKAPGGPDGMKVDRDGDVFCTGPGGIWIMTPNGKHVGTIVMPAPATNFAFGDPDYKTLYITDRRSLVKIRLNTSGIAPGPSQH